MIRSIEEIKAQVKLIDKNVSGIVRLGASIFFTEYVLPTLIEEFKKEYPETGFSISTGSSQQIYNELSENEIHIGFLRGDYEWNEEKHLLFEGKLCLVSKSPIDYNNLPKMGMIDYKKGYVHKDLIEQWWVDTFDNPPSISMEVDNTQICKEMILKNLGYGILPYIMIEDIKDDLTVIDLTTKNGKPITRNSWMYFRAEALVNPAARAFIEFIENHNL